MIKKLIHWLYRRELHSLYSGRGYIQGMGMDITVNVIYICGIKFITDINIDVDTEWLRNLKLRMQADDIQQDSENMRKKINCTTGK